MLQAYVINVSSVMYVAAIVLCCKCSMSRHEKWAQAEVVPVDAAVLACAREASGRIGPHMHAYRSNRRMRTAASGGAGPATTYLSRYPSASSAKK